MKNKKYYLMSLLLGVGSYAMSQTVPSMSAFHDGIHHWNLEHKERNYKRYSPEQLRRLLIILLLIRMRMEDGPKILTGWQSFLPILS